MTVTTSCPTCMSLFRLPAELAGRQVRCQKCENTFIVPEFVPGGMETTTAVSAEPAEISAPPSAASVEPPPPAPPPHEAPAYVAKVVEEVVTVPAPATTPPIEIVVVEDEPTAPATVTPAEPAKPSPLLPSPEPSRWLGFGLLASFLATALLVLCVSVWWVGRHLDARQMSQPGRTPTLSARAIPIEFGTDGRLTVLGQTRQPDFGRDEPRWRHDGPFELYSIHLEQGKMYNFCVNGATISPRLRIYEGRFNHSADRFGLIPENTVIIAYQPNRTGEHLLFVSSSNRVVGDFLLSVAEQRAAEAPLFDLGDQPSVVVKGELSLDHPLHDIGNNSTGVYREYRVALEQNRGYSFTVASDEFQPKIVIYDRNNRPMEFPRLWNQQNNKTHTFTYRPFLAGIYRVRVLGERFGLGAYTLRVSDTSNVRPVQTMIVTFQDGVFDDRRAFVKTDPVEPSKPGLGPYKEYVVTLERDRRYRIEMKSELFGTKLTVTNDRAQRVAGDTDIRNQPLIFAPAFTGQYQIRAIGENRKAIGEYQLRIEQLP